MNEDDPIAILEARIAVVQAERSAEVESISTRIRAASQADGDDVLDDQIADLKDHVSAEAANMVTDEDADRALESASERFTEAVSNASLEKRVAALLTVMDGAEIGA